MFMVNPGPVLRFVSGLLLLALSVVLNWLSRHTRSIFAIKDWLLVQLQTANWVIGILYVQ